MATLEPDRIAGRVAEILPYFPGIAPNSMEKALIERIAHASLRIEECDRMEATLLDRERARARAGWLERHAAEIRHLVEELPRDPAKISPRIESTYFGARWKLACWDELAAMLHEHGDWPHSSETLAWNLVGLRPPRNHPPIDPRTLRARRDEILESERRRLARLAEETLRPRYDRELHAAERMADLEPSPTLKRVRSDRAKARGELMAACRLLPRAVTPGGRADRTSGSPIGPDRQWGRANPLILGSELA